jgi:hypothetical protein
VEAFTEILEVYEQIGENLPLLLQYQELFQTKPDIIQALVLTYKEILEFHRLALHYFSKPRRYLVCPSFNMVLIMGSLEAAL